MNYQRNPMRYPNAVNPPEPQVGRRPMGNGCGCCEHGGNKGGVVGPDCLRGMSLAMVYSPYQHFRDIYTPDVALDRGTLFSELDLPFEGAGNKRNGGCIR